MNYFLAFAGFVFLIVMHEFGHFLAAKRVGMRVERFSLFFPPLLLKHKRGETEYAVGAIPLGGYVKITGMNPEEDIPEDVRPRAYYNQPVWKRILVIACGPAMNLLIAIVIFTALNMFSRWVDVPLIEKTTPDSPASKVLERGDKIVKVDGEPGSLETYIKRIRSHKCAGKSRSGCVAEKPVELSIVRDGKPMTISVRPRYDKSQRPFGMRIGFSYQRISDDYSLPRAFVESLNTTWFVTERTFSVLSRIIDPEQRKQLSGVVGGYTITKKQLDFSFTNALWVLAVISLSLAIINLFPFLPLDGGHIFFSLAEKVRGKPISFETMQRASVFGFMLVIVLFVIGLTNDIGRLTGEGFNIR